MPRLALALLLASLAMTSRAGAAPVISGEYYEESKLVACGSLSCRIDFSLTPAGKWLDIEQVACYASLSARIRILYLGASRTSGGEVLRYIPVPFASNATGDGKYYYNILNPVKFRVGPQRHPLVAAESTVAAAGALVCTITGSLIDQ